MGLGGYLTWTAVAEEIKKKLGKDVKFLPVEKYGNNFRLVESEIFEHNKNFTSRIEDANTSFPIILNNPNANYCKLDTPEKAYHRHDSHIIEQACEVYDIKNPVLKCYLDLHEQEVEHVENLIREIGANQFIAIEPSSKDNYTVNRRYSFEKWQMIANELKNLYPIIQIGNSEKLLKNVVNLTGKTTFSQAAGLLGRSRLFLSTEGGLVHAATAFSTKSVVVITGYQSEKMVAYPQNININISKHGPCGLKKQCDQCFSDVENHDWQEIVEKVKRELQK